ncbi:MAG: domain S-box-containing protein [Mucilaginibacter sp.]|uniref:PAS domain-containing sensor histidine kinase n=1 Tax=Mucilaginibacter sp. TaxID=1882438 RepID=UPI002629581F|nr:PAS domain-containing sensor histidine kinase [Mucilaginibacter sp.]MDB5002705.1 domain S-box-containing protein [Mucilaginibacter sp.]
MNAAKDLTHLLSNETFDLDLFVQSSPDMICIAGYDGFFKKINPAVSKTLGYTQDELLSKPINEFVYLEDKAATNESRESIKRSVPLINFENRYLTKSGDIVWLSWTSIGIEEQQLVFAIAKNITHKKRLEEDRNLLLTNLTKTNNELKQLAYTTAHDLRSPVNSLLSIFSIIDEQTVDNEEVVELLSILKKSTENLRNTLNNYVDVLIQKKSLNIEVSEVSLTESFNTVQRLLRSLIIDTKTEITSDFKRADVINFNKAYLDSIFLNLLSNSIKYAKPNTYPKISLHSEKVNGIVKLIFKDEGLGFDMEKVQGRIFGFNQTFHDNKDSKGIGLYLVHNHLTSLGGHIDIDSRINEGATFTITFKA